MRQRGPQIGAPFKDQPYVKMLLTFNYTTRPSLTSFALPKGYLLATSLCSLLRHTHCAYFTILGPVHMIPGQLIAPGQLTDPRVNFASVHGLTPVTVHMSFSFPRGNFERWVTRCTTPGNPPCRGNFS